MTQSSLKFVPYGTKLRASVVIIPKEYFGNYGNNKPIRGGSTFAIQPVASSQPRVGKRSTLTPGQAVA